MVTFYIFHSFAYKSPYSQSYGFPSSHIWMYNKKGWAPKNWCLQTVAWEKTPESPLDCREIKPVNPKENQPWIFTGRTDDGAEAPILSPPDGKNRLIGKDPDTGKDWRQEEKGTTEDETWMALPTQWTWVWASSGRCWRTKKPDVLQFMGSQSRTWPSNWTTIHLLRW